MVSVQVLNKENEHCNILSTVPGQPQNIIKIVDTDVSKDIICDIEAKNVQDNQEKHKFVKNTSNISSESLNPEEATSNIYLADDSTKIHVDLTPEINNCAGISDPNKLSTGTDQNIVCEVTENTKEPYDSAEYKLRNLTSPKQNESCKGENSEISLDPVQNVTTCTSDPDYFGVSDSNKKAVSSSTDQEIVSCKTAGQNDTRCTSDPDYFGIYDSNKESVTSGMDQEIACKVTENTKEPYDSAEDKLQNLTSPKQNESCKDEHLGTISLEHAKLPVQSDVSSSVPDVSDDKLKSTESSDESNMQHETSPIATSKTTEKSDESFLSKKDSVEQILEENSGFDEQVFRTNSDTRNTPTILNRTFSLGYNDETPSPEIEPKMIDIDSFKTSTPSKKHKKTSLSESPKKSPRKPNYDFLKTGQINLESWDKFLGDSFERNNEDDDSVFDDCDKDLNSSTDTTSDSSFKDLSENTDDNKENIKYQETSSSDTTDSDLKFHSTNSDEEQDSVKLAEIRRALILSLPDAQ
ncbi:dentin sialophosphoprotein-like, partial [Ctenocephalides felis]|uniref:dentin sialophosphoprotein-like n=1 Tax=Ctenocephalides felis TaxID=7515 RepID=UPI000E6E3CFC